ncbi:Spermidine/spermine synthase [Cyathus striatus]|nr:Spermidine/spermine synthase [Cyathus striatus]
MTLKVKNALHVEKSLYKDVLILESESLGNLVLDPVYQEMIAHLPLASHPNPKKVVIGGGDGGVVREVLKHDTVQEVVLPSSASRRHTLPYMSSLLASPKVRVYVGDGFKFLADNEGTYDVIITNSSDPVGPAEYLFQKP